MAYGGEGGCEGGDRGEGGEDGGEGGGEGAGGEGGGDGGGGEGGGEHSPGTLAQDMDPAEPCSASKAALPAHAQRIATMLALSNCKSMPSPSSPPFRGERGASKMRAAVHGGAKGWVTLKSVGGKAHARGAPQTSGSCS